MEPMSRAAIASQTRNVRAPAAIAGKEVRGAALASRPLTNPALSREQKAEKAAQGVQSIMNSPWQLMMVLLPSFALRKVGAMKLSGNLRAVGHMATQAPQQLPISDLFKLPGAALKVGADQYAITGHTAERVAKINGVAERVDGAMGRYKTALADPVKNRLSSAIDKATEGKSGGFLSRRLEGLATSRHKVNMKKSLGEEAQKLVGTALKEHKGVFSGLEAHATVDVKAMGAAARVEHFETLAAKARAFMVPGASSNYAVREAAEKIGQQALQAAGHARAALAHGEASGKGLNVLLKNALRMGGRTPVMTVMLGVGAAAAGTAAYFGTRHANNVEEKTLGSLSKDIGDKNSPYVKAVRESFVKEKKGRWASAGVSTAGEALIAATMGTHGMMGGAMNAAAVGAPMLGQVLVKESPALNAYANLQKAESGEVQMEKADKVAQVRQLVGVGIDVIPQPNGKQRTGDGYYNKLSAPIAAKIVEQNLSLSDTVKLVSNPEKLAAMGKEVQAAQAAAAASPKGKNLTNDGENSHAVTMQDYADEHAEMKSGEKAVAQAQKTSLLAAAPSAKVDMRDAAHEGMLEQHLAKGHQQ